MESGENKPLSIVIPVYNRADIVTRTLDSIASQKGIERCRVILVDNNSTDDTLEALSRWKNSPQAERLDVTILSEKRPGACAARNRGLAEVTTPFLQFFDSDDVMLPGLIDTLLEAITNDAGRKVYYWPVEMELVNGAKRFTRVSRTPSDGDDKLWFHIVHAFLATQHFAVSTAVARDAGAWDETLPCWNDYEWGLRLLLAGCEPVKLSSKPLVRTYFTEQSITGRGFSGRAEGCERSLDLCQRSLVKARRSTRWIDYRRVILAAAYRREGRKDHARRLLNATLSRYSAMRRAPLRLIYVKHLLYGRGSAVVASFFFGKSIKSE